MTHLYDVAATFITRSMTGIFIFTQGHLNMVAKHPGYFENQII